jgi:hypothetical protein
MGHAQLQTTEIYADYAPSSHEKEMVERAFAPPESDEEDDPPADDGDHDDDRDADAADRAPAHDDVDPDEDVRGLDASEPRSER